jgi:hypothetical protein
LLLPMAVRSGSFFPLRPSDTDFPIASLGATASLVPSARTSSRLKGFDGKSPATGASPAASSPSSAPARKTRFSPSIALWLPLA